MMTSTHGAVGVSIDNNNCPVLNGIWLCETNNYTVNDKSRILYERFTYICLKTKLGYIYKAFVEAGEAATYIIIGSNITHTYL